MTRPRLRPARRAGHRRTSVLLASALAAGLAAAVGLAPGWATASPTVTGVARAATDPATDPGGDPTDGTPTGGPTTTEPAPTTAPPTESAPPTSVPPAPTTTAPAPTTTTPGKPRPTTTAPTTTAPAPPPAAPPAAPGQSAGGRLGVRVTTEDVTLTPAYWNADRTVTTLRVTVTNTGGATARVRLGYTLPAGLTDAGTAGCAPAGGGTYRCGGWTTAPGTRFRSSIRIRVAGTAWRSMPLSGSVRVTATAPGASGAATDDEGFAVLFPPGPPAPGIALHAEEVLFGVGGDPTTLAVRLGNTGKADAAGRVEVVLPAGVTPTDPPAGCTAVAPTRTRCDLGTVPAGRSATLRLPVAATPEAQRRAPLSGAVAGRLEPRSGRDRQVQMSFRITSAAALALPVAAGSEGVLAHAGRAADEDGFGPVRTAVVLIAASGLVVVLALVLATTSLRRRTGAGPAADPTRE
ncbi:hypothetical protein ONA91_17410 [Micromonospora sp. DR5-3]|uniref:hypothetical protein n=1 Tax=unclassified Micromonospora TaxID=2617518 RepID=UPI0011D7E4A3|nr:MULTISPECIES: hypothetical protein [unclassified Micromonospora]MCW3816224.1 hypothetical protein [Micromonospora sp. DR5-3]TYC23959.1 hypothetical protein FXF52_13070 [Micromonospora sp. MP36]